MKESNVEIVSDGLPRNTHVYVDGVELKGITSLKIDCKASNAPLTATITIIGAKLSIKCRAKIKNEDA